MPRMVPVEYRGGPRDGKQLPVNPRHPPPAVPVNGTEWYVLRKDAQDCCYYRWVAEAYPGSIWQRVQDWLVRPRSVLPTP